MGVEDATRLSKSGKTTKTGFAPAPPGGPPHPPHPPPPRLQKAYLAGAPQRTFVLASEVYLRLAPGINGNLERHQKRGFWSVWVAGDDGGGGGEETLSSPPG